MHDQKDTQESLLITAVELTTAFKVCTVEKATFSEKYGRTSAIN